MRTRSRNPFASVKTAGLLLPVDLLTRIVEGDRDLPGLSPESYHLLPGERLNEAASRAWNRCLAAWKVFRHQADRLPASDAGTTLTRERWLLPLFQELGYGRLQANREGIQIDDRSYPVSHAWGKHVPIHLVSFRYELDKRTPGVAGAATRSPYSMMQELLNRSPAHRWGFVSNGRRLVILRDNVALVRSSNVEFDLDAMMEGEVYADFTLLFLLCHQSRVEIPPDGKPEDCWLEKWANRADEQGTRAREHLRDGVEAAIQALGAGFLTTRGNTALRDRLRSGQLSTQNYYRQLLRLVYRLLMLLVAEEKRDENGNNLLHPPETPPEVRQRYARFYSVGRIRQLAATRRGTAHTDLYESLKVLFLKLREGYAPLGIPGLGSFLFSAEATPDLDQAALANVNLLDCFRQLTYTLDTSGRGGAVRRPVDFANLGSEELGSVYESLLELHPQIDTDKGPFTLTTAAGHERKTTGSYYTPTSLINCLLDSALDPVVEEALAKPEPEQALLDLKICDPACGSGHFLIAAAERLAKHLARLRTGDDEPSTLEIQRARRDIIGRCIFGVDINPMAVELCKVSLWMEALTPGRPLTFLDAHIQCGNSLLGATPRLLAEGIPDEAFKPIEGDDKALCREYKKQNRDERRGQKLFPFEGTGKPWERMGDLATALAQLDDASDATVEATRRKQERYAQLVSSSGYLSTRFWADTWCAAFVWKKTRQFDYAITEDVFRRIERNPHDSPPWMRDEIQRLARQYQFFHWHLAFPQVFRVPTADEEPHNEQTGWSGGFDVVLGNPPWERIQAEAVQFFATRRPEFLDMKRSERNKAIRALESDDATLYREWLSQRRYDLSINGLLKNAGRYKRSTTKNINSYAVFIELAMELTAGRGRCGMLSQSGIVTDDIMKEMFQFMLASRRLVSLFDFENREKIFPAVHPQLKFCLVTVAGPNAQHHKADFVFYATRVSDLSDPIRHFSLSEDDVALLNPNTRTCPIFRSKQAAALAMCIYGKARVLIREANPATNPWNVSIRRMFDMAYDSHLFRSTSELLDADYSLTEAREFHKGDEEWVPLYEAKLVHQFNHRYATFPDGGNTNSRTTDSSATDVKDAGYLIMPRYWVSREDYRRKMSSTGWRRDWIIGSREITNTTNERTSIFAIMPNVGIGHTCYTLTFVDVSPRQLACFVANANSFCFDWVTRQKLAGTHLSVFILKQLPFIMPESYTERCPWGDARCTAQDWLGERVLGLTSELLT